VRTLLFWLFTTLLSPILWLLDRLWLGARIEGGKISTPCRAVRSA
jgi:hypothetical protein